MGKIERLEAVCPLFVEMARNAVRNEHNARDRRRVSQAKRVHDGTGIVGRRDFGPAIRRLNGHIVVEYRADPDPCVGALIHAGRVRDGLQMMYRAGQLSIQEWHACCRFRDDIDFANGAQALMPDKIGIRVACTGGVTPGEMRMDCMARVHDVWRKLELGHTTIAASVVVLGGTIGDYARAQRMRKADASTLFHEAVDLIFEFYDAQANIEMPGEGQST